MNFYKKFAIIVLLLVISVVQPSYGQPEEPGAEFLPPGAEFLPPDADYNPPVAEYNPSEVENKPPEAEETPPEYEPPPPEGNDSPPWYGDDYPPGEWVVVQHGDNPPESMFMPHGADFAGPEAGYQPPKPQPKPTKPPRKPPKQRPPKKEKPKERPRPTRPAEIEAAEFRAKLKKTEKDYFAAVGNTDEIVYSVLSVFMFLAIFIFGLIAFIQNRSDKLEPEAQEKYATHIEWKKAGLEHGGLEQVIVEPPGLEQAGAEQTDLEKVIVE